MIKKIIHLDPFLGEIELSKIYETSMNAMGETRVDTIYSDKMGNIYIQTWVTTGGDAIPMIYLRKGLVDKIKELC